MRMKPNAGDLLSTAIKIFKEEIIPNISHEKKYQSLMIASALSTVERQITSTGKSEQKELDRLSKLFPKAPLTGHQNEDLLTLNTYLIQYLKSTSNMDDDFLKTKIHSHLMCCAKDEIGESNPKFLTKIPTHYENKRQNSPS